MFRREQGQEPLSDLHTRQLCFLQLFLRHTLRAGTLRELGGARVCTHVGADTDGEREGEGAGVGDSTAVYF